MYATNVNQGGIDKIPPDGKVVPFLYDPKLLHRPDALWITADGQLWILVPQLDRTAGLPGVVGVVQDPIHVYTVQ